MWVLWTVTRFTSTMIVTLSSTSTTCPTFQTCTAPASVAVQRTFYFSWWHLVFTVIGAVLLLAASVMLLRTPRSVEEI
jgi:hypothetical protein